MVRRVLGTVAAGLLALVPLGCGQSVFTCQSNAQCVGPDAGVCQPDGYCSFPAADCPSGQRYGAHSGPQSGQCVGGDETGTTGETGSTTTSGGPTGTPTEPMLDTGEATTDAATTREPGTTEPVVTTGDDATSSEPTTGEPVDPDLVLWLELDALMDGEVPDSSSFMGPGGCEPGRCPVLVGGVVGQAAAFDGVDDAITVPHAPWLETTEGYTIAAWLRVDALTAGHHAVLAKPVGNGIANSWEFYFWESGFYLGMGTPEQYADLWVPWTAPSGTWVHLAGTWDGASLTLWIDGAHRGTTAMTAIGFDDHPVVVGADDDHYGDLSGHLQGAVDDVRVYRRALSADEVAALAGR
jgi:hypothetical protein